MYLFILHAGSAECPYKLRWITSPNLIKTVKPVVNLSSIEDKTVPIEV